MPPEIYEIYEKMVISILKTVYDPELPVNIYDLGLIYKIDIDEDLNLDIDMTLTAPNCPMADEIMDTVYTKLNSIQGLKSVKVNLVFYPPWDRHKLSDEVKLELGLL